MRIASRICHWIVLFSLVEFAISFMTLQECAKPIDGNVTGDNQTVIQLDNTWHKYEKHHDVWCTKGNTASTLTIGIHEYRNFSLFGTIEPFKNDTKTLPKITMNGTSLTLDVTHCKLSTTPLKPGNHSLKFENENAECKLCLILHSSQPQLVVLANSTKASSSQVLSPASSTSKPSSTASSTPSNSNNEKVAVTTGVAVAFSVLAVSVIIAAIVWYVRRRRRLIPIHEDTGPQLELAPYEPSAPAPAIQVRQPRTSRRHRPRYWASRSHPSVGSIPQPPSSVDPPSSAPPSVVHEVEEVPVEASHHNKRKKRKTVLRAVNA